jgi:hypothetical protein
MSVLLSNCVLHECFVVKLTCSVAGQISQSQKSDAAKTIFKQFEKFLPLFFAKYFLPDIRLLVVSLMTLVSPEVYMAYNGRNVKLTMRLSSFQVRNLEKTSLRCKVFI